MIKKHFEGFVMKYEKLSKDLQERIEYDRENNINLGLAFNEKNIVRRDSSRDKASLWRSASSRDIDKIIHSPFYNRYQDKTQVFSFYKNDDISHRAIHVQLVSHIARNIGSILGLNLNLIEAIALGHDIGHTPFGHAGERILNEIYNEKTSRYFSHNIHSARVLDSIYPLNLSLQTLNGIISHNGEFECKEYVPKTMESFAQLDEEIENCCLDIKHNKALMPSTLEGCVVRVCDMIAYLGKDRQDAVKAKIIPADYNFGDTTIGRTNAEIINNLVVNIIENSYGKNYIMLDKEHYDALVEVKKNNFDIIYKNNAIEKQYNESIRPMMFEMYNRLVSDIENGNKSSKIFTHHINLIDKSYYTREVPYIEEDKHQIVVDYIASMTDDYFIDLYNYLFPDSSYEIAYKGYFE